MEAAQILDAVAGKFDVAPAASSPVDRVYFDTFDGRLRQAGLRMWRDRRRRHGAGVSLTLEAAGSRTSVAASPGRRDRILAEDMPEGSVRAAVEPVIDVRALLPAVHVRGRRLDAALRNRDAKTVTRLVVEDLEVVNGRDTVALGRRVELAAMLGYEKQQARAARLLEEKLGLLPSKRSVVDDSLDALGQPDLGRTSRVDVRLEPEMRAAEAMVLVSRRLAEIVELNLPGTLADLDVEFLHDLRVAIRRTRSVLKELKDVLPAEKEQQARVELRWVQEITGRTRDLDVQLLEWPATVEAASASMAGDLHPLHDLLVRHRAAAFSAMRRQLTGRRFADAWKGWRALIDDPARWRETAGPKADARIGDLAGRRITAVFGSMVRMGSAIDEHSPAEALHDLRKRGKELRYLLELFGGMWPPAQVKPLVSALKDFQDVLGRFQDHEIQCAYLRRLGPELAAVPGGTDALIALGVVIDDLVTDQRQARADFATRFEAFARPDNRELVRRTFAGHGDKRGAVR